MTNGTRIEWLIEDFNLTRYSFFKAVIHQLLFKPQLSKNQLGVISYWLLDKGLKGMASVLYVTDDRNIKSGCHPISNND